MNRKHTSTFVLAAALITIMTANVYAAAPYKLVTEKRSPIPSTAYTNNKQATAENTTKSAASKTAEKTSQKTESGKSSQNAKTTKIETQEVRLTDDMRFSEFSKINSGSAVLYKNKGAAHEDIIVCVNAGHGTKGGTKVKTQSHPDGSKKTTGGSTAKGAVQSTAVSSGMEFADGTPEPVVTLKEAQILKKKLLDRGYSVLMIRDSEDVQLDNIARTVLANTYADCHVAIHWDSSTSDKGAFFMSVPDAMKHMDPVNKTWEKSEAFGHALINGLKGRDVKIFGDGTMDIDLTQTSYSSIASVDIELGDKVSDHSDTELEKLADGLADGIEMYFKTKKK